MHVCDCARGWISAALFLFLLVCSFCFILACLSFYLLVSFFFKRERKKTWSWKSGEVGKIWEAIREGKL